MLKKICFSSQINLTTGERPNKKNIESLNLTWKVNLLRLWRGKLIIEIKFETKKVAFCGHTSFNNKNVQRNTESRSFLWDVEELKF